jgi:hypothetical protein
MPVSKKPRKNGKNTQKWQATQQDTKYLRRAMLRAHYREAKKTDPTLTFPTFMRRLRDHAMQLINQDIQHVRN